MRNKKRDKKRFSKGIIKAVIVSSLVALATVSLLVTNIFFPIKYLSAYVNFSSDVNSDGQMRVRFLDVGFGDSALVELPDGKIMLIDGGSDSYSSRLKILKTLNKSKIDKIDYLVCTSVRGEHCGGLSEIIKYKQVGTAYIPYCLNTDVTPEYAAFIRTLEGSGAKKKICEYGEGIYSDCGYFFCFVSPSVHTAPDTGYDNLNEFPSESNINNASAVLWLEYEGKGLLFLSDSTSETQAQLYASLQVEEGYFDFFGNRISPERCIAVRAANHGAKDSVDENFYDLFSPEASIISVGENGKNYPATETLMLIQKYSQVVYRTDDYGTITITVDSSDHTISKEKL